MKKIDNMRKKLGIVIFLLIIVICIYVVLIVLPNRKNDYRMDSVNKIKFGYTLYKRDNDVYKEVYKLLEMELSNETINYEKYAEYISKLFIIDLYTLNNKMSKDDAGGVQYIKDEMKDNFILNVSRTLYKYINVNNVELPEVSSIELDYIKDCTYPINNKEYFGYEVKLKWEYKKEMGYDNEAIIYVIKDKEKLYIVEKK